LAHGSTLADALWAQFCPLPNSTWQFEQSRIGRAERRRGDIGARVDERVACCYDLMRGMKLQFDSTRVMLAEILNLD
jgi:hypothetical protein